MQCRLAACRSAASFRSADAFQTDRGEAAMNFQLHLTFAPIVALIAGILILVMPRLLNYIVAIYLILIGLLGLLGRV
jgi:uncharacterized Tic20 family protein